MICPRVPTVLALLKHPIANTMFDLANAETTAIAPRMVELAIEARVSLAVVITRAQ